MALQSFLPSAFNPVYRCSAGKSTMHAAYRVHFCLFETNTGEIPCICARKVLCCLYIAVFCGVRREKKRKARPSGERRPSRGKENGL